jgi:lysozyme family protein
MADFLIAVNKTLGYEDGLDDDPDDPGGLTNFGIALNKHPELTADDIRNMTRDRAIEIYRTSYWLDLYDQISSQVLANCLFDFGVTSGPITACKKLQAILFSHTGGVPDGIFGEATLEATNRNTQFYTKEFIVDRLRFYAGLNKPQFLKSWFTRTIDAML